MKRRHTPVFIALNVSLAFGLLTCCINAVNSQSTSSSETDDGHLEVPRRAATERPTLPVVRTFSLGSGTGLLTKECDLHLDETAVIESITRSCGCTEIGLKEGQSLSSGDTFLAKIDLSSKPAGTGKQSAMVELDNGVRFHLEFIYVHEPPAFCKPEYVILTGIGSSVVVEFFLPPEPGIVLSGADLPTGIKVLEDGDKHGLSSREEKQSYRLRVVAEREPEHFRGVLLFHFSSEDRLSFSIPYLYLSNGAVE